ncbi:MAG: adenylate kinase family protein [Nitrososphaerota archaeon]
MSLVITGNPGVGKHTISKLVAKKLNYEILDINKIALKSMNIKKTSGTADIDTKKVKSVIKKIITKNSLVVGHLAPYVLTKSQIKAVVVLRKNPYSLISVYKERKYTRQKVIENLDSEILGVIAYDSIKKFGINKVYQIDTTKKSLAMIVKKIQSIFENNFKQDKVDWLTLVVHKNDLKKFFTY